MQKVLITGGLGFIGSNLVDRLLQKGDKVIGIDNFSTGRTQFLKNAKKNKKLNFLIQELGREINTIGSKTDDLSVSHLSLDMKNELEKIREQVQNIV